MKFDGECFSVHVELSFREGRIGGDDDSFPFTFSVSLKKAVLVLKVDNPLKIDRSSIARHIPSIQTEKTSTYIVREEIKQTNDLSGKLDAAKMSASLSGKNSTTIGDTNETQYKYVESVPQIIAKPVPTARDEYAWELSPGRDHTLSGMPWDPVTEPRFSVTYMAEDGPRIEPVIKAVVMCRLEDVAILDLKIKDDSFFNKVKDKLFPELNKAAAIQHLKLTLQELNLEAGKFEDAYSNLIIADVLAAEL